MKRFLILVVLLVLGAGVWLYFNGANQVRDIIVTAASESAGVDVSLDRVELDVWNGEATLYGLKVANPAGYSSRKALSVDVIKVGLDPSSVNKDVLTITTIYVENSQLSYEVVGGVSNYEVIGQNAKSSSGGSSEEEADAQRFIVNTLEFTDGNLIASGVRKSGKDIDVVLPGFRLQGIGRKEGGLTASQIASRITVAITSQVIGTVVSGALFDIVTDPVGSVTDMLPGF